MLMNFFAISRRHSSRQSANSRKQRDALCDARPQVPREEEAIPARLSFLSFDPLTQKLVAQRPVLRRPPLPPSSEDGRRERESEEQPDGAPVGKGARRPHVRRWEPREPLPAVGKLRPGVLRPTAKEFLVHVRKHLGLLGLSHTEECAQET